MFFKKNLTFHSIFDNILLLKENNKIYSRRYICKFCNYKGRVNNSLEKRKLIITCPVCKNKQFSKMNKEKLKYYLDKIWFATLAPGYWYLPYLFCSIILMTLPSPLTLMFLFFFLLKIYFTIKILLISYRAWMDYKP